MQIRWWEKWASYLFEIRKEVSSSDFNDHLEVLISKGRYQLCTENAIYSYDDLYDNYFRAFQILLKDNWEFNKVLILGLGLGSIPSMLEKKYGVKTDYTAVEIDEEVVRMAHRYVLHELTSNITVYTTDAQIFVNQHEEIYDLICVDLFVDDIIPNKFQTTKFLQSVKKLLSPKGVVMYNRLSRTDEDLKKTKAFLEEIFKEVFPDARHLDLRGNWMLLNR